MHQFSDIITALPHLHKPRLRYRPQVGRTVGKPDVNGRIAFSPSRQPQDILHTDQPAEVQRNAMRSMYAHSDEVERRGIALPLNEGT